MISAIEVMALDRICGLHLTRIKQSKCAFGDDPDGFLDSGWHRFNKSQLSQGRQMGCDLSDREICLAQNGELESGITGLRLRQTSNL